MEGAILINPTELKNLVAQEVQQILASLNLVSIEAKDVLLGLEAACSYLNLKPSTIYDLKYQNKIPTLKRGRKLCFSKLALDAWNDAGRPANEEEWKTRIDVELTAASKSRKKRI